MCVWIINNNDNNKKLEKCQKYSIGFLQANNCTRRPSILNKTASLKYEGMSTSL